MAELVRVRPLALALGRAPAGSTRTAANLARSVILAPR